MRNLLILMALLVLPFKVCMAKGQPPAAIHNVDMTQVYQNWDTLKKTFYKKVDSAFTKKKDEAIEIFLSNVNKAAFFCTDFGAMTEDQIAKFQKIQNQFIEDLAKKYPSPLKNQIDTLRKTNNKLTTENQNLQSQIDTFFDLKTIIILSIATLLLIFLLFLKKKKKKNYVNKDEYDAIAEVDNVHLKGENEQLKSENKRLKSQLSDLQNRAPEIVEKIIYKEASQNVQATKVTKYLCRLTENGAFGRIDDNYDEFSSYYYIKVPVDLDLHDSSKKIQFAFNGDSERAIQNWSSVLSPAAEFEGSYKTSKSVKTLEPGVIQYDSANERWNVIKKAKLKLY